MARAKVPPAARIRRAYVTAVKGLQKQARAWEAAANADPRFNLMQEPEDLDWGPLTGGLLDAWDTAASGVYVRARNASMRAARGRFPQKQRVPSDDGLPAREGWLLVRAEELAAEFLDAGGTRLIRSQQQGMLDAIYQVLAESIRNGTGTARAARDLRQSIGLLPRDARALSAFRERQAKSGATQAAQDKVVERYRDRLIRRRATTIARTETAAARTRGMLGGWKLLTESGDLPVGMMKRWVAVDACPVCTALAESPPVPLDAQFSAGGVSVLGAPAHPNCTCTQELVEEGAEKVAPRIRSKTALGSRREDREGSCCDHASCSPGPRQALHRAAGESRGRPSVRRDGGHGSRLRAG